MTTTVETSQHGPHLLILFPDTYHYALQHAVSIREGWVLIFDTLSSLTAMCKPPTDVMSCVYLRDQLLLVFRADAKYELKNTACLGSTILLLVSKSADEHPVPVSDSLDSKKESESHLGDVKNQTQTQTHCSYLGNRLVLTPPPLSRPLDLVDAVRVRPDYPQAWTFILKASDTLSKEGASTLPDPLPWVHFLHGKQLFLIAQKSESKFVHSTTSSMGQGWMINVEEEKDTKKPSFVPDTSSKDPPPPLRSRYIDEVDTRDPQGSGFEMHFYLEKLMLEASLYAKDTEESKRMLDELSVVSTTGFLAAHEVLRVSQGSTLESESKRLDIYPEFVSAQKRVRCALAKNLLSKGSSSMNEDQLIAVSMYTDDTLYGIINKAWRDNKVSVMLNYDFLMSLLIKGIRHLPPAPEVTLFRGIMGDPATYKEGKMICFNQLLSASSDRDTALSFVQRQQKPSEVSKQQGILLVLLPMAARCIQAVSRYPEEHEFLVRPFGHFRVLSKEWNTQLGVWVVRLQQLMEDIRGSRILLWVDDRPLGDNCHLPIRIECEKAGITVICMKSTADVVRCLPFLENLLKRDLSRLRVVTDMARVEEGKGMNIRAGIEFCLLLRQLKYTQHLLVFTGDKYCKENTAAALQAGLENITVTSSSSKVVPFCTFASEGWQA